MPNEVDRESVKKNAWVEEAVVTSCQEAPNPNAEKGITLHWFNFNEKAIVCVIR